MTVDQPQRPSTECRFGSSDLAFYCSTHRSTRTSLDGARCLHAYKNQHDPGDHHRYRIECEVCGQRGTIRLSVDPDRGPESRDSEPPLAIKGRYYPEMPPGLPGETDEQYTDRLTGADGTDRRPYDHDRNRQCSIGYHGECSDPTGTNGCECPCHRESSVRPIVGRGMSIGAVRPEEPPR